MTDRAHFENLCAAWPGVTFVAQWDSYVAKVGGKVFALHGNIADGNAVFSGGIVFKVAETSFEILTDQDGITQAPYFAKRHWVYVAPGALSVADLGLYLRASYDRVAAGLTKKLQRELGLLTP